MVLAGVAVGLQNWAYQETNVWEKTIGLFERCTDFKGGKTECSSVTASNCKASQKEGDPDDCDESTSTVYRLCAWYCGTVWCVRAVPSRLISSP